MIIINMNNSTEKVHNASQRKHIAFDCTGRSKQHERVMLCTQKCVSINSIRNEENIEYQRKMMNSSNRTYTASDKSPFNTFSYTGNMKMVKPLEQHRDKKMEQDKKNNSKYSDAFKGYQEDLQESFVPINHFNYRSFHFNIDKANRKETQSRIQKAIHDKKDIESYNDYSQKKRSHSIAGSITNPSFLISRPRNHSMLRKVIGNSQKFRQFQNNLKAKIFVVSLTDLMINNAQQEEKKNVKKQEIQIQKNGSIEINSAFETIKQVNNDSQRNNKQFHIHHPHKRNILMHRNEKHINIIEPVFIEPPKLPIKGWSNIQQQATISNLQQLQN